MPRGRQSGKIFGWLYPDQHKQQIFMTVTHAMSVKSLDAVSWLQVSVLLLDILHLLLIENAVVVCKFNPVLSHLGPYAE